jgi:uncharacterized membrane protein YqjE
MTAGSQSAGGGPASPDPSPGEGRAETARRPGLRDALGSAAHTLASILHTRVELASLEFTEERDRAKRQLALVLLVAIASGFALLVVNVLFVAASWDRLGLWSLAMLLALYLTVAGVGAWRLATIGRRERRAFDATLSELERDRAWLAERLGGGRT